MVCPICNAEVVVQIARDAGGVQSRGLVRDYTVRAVQKGSQSVNCV